MSEEDCIDVLEVSVANVIGFGAKKLFCNARPDFEGSVKMVFDHKIFHGKSGERKIKGLR